MADGLQFRSKSSMFHYVLIKEERIPSHRLRRNGILHEPYRISECHLLFREKHWKARKIRKVRTDSERSWTVRNRSTCSAKFTKLSTSCRISLIVLSHPRYLIFVIQSFVILGAKLQFLFERKLEN